MAAELPISAFKRVPFVDDIAILGPDHRTSAFLMHIRNRQGDTGAPLVTLATASAGTQGISCTYNAAYIYNDEGDTAPASLIAINISEATLEGLAPSNPTNAPVVLHYDLHVTPSGGVKRVEMYGTFTIYPGVTI
jgi:hypothetical protein